MLSPLRKVAIFTKRVILDEIFIFRDSLMPEYQLIDENENIAVTTHPTIKISSYCHFGAELVPFFRE